HPDQWMLGSASVVAPDPRRPAQADPDHDLLSVTVHVSDLLVFDRQAALHLIQLIPEGGEAFWIRIDVGDLGDLGEWSFVEDRLKETDNGALHVPVAIDAVDKNARLRASGRRSDVHGGGPAFADPDDEARGLHRAEELGEVRLLDT